MRREFANRISAWAAAGTAVVDAGAAGTDMVLLIKTFTWCGWSATPVSI
jgi:hypothetical protein